MKKTFITASLLMSMMVAGVASANQVLPEINKIKPDLETIMVGHQGGKSGPRYKVIDHNPTLYNKQVVGGHTVEGWTKDKVAYTKVDGNVTKAYRINKDLETIKVGRQGGKSGPRYEVIDHNPTLYNKQVVGGHSVEGWIKDGVVYTKTDGVITKKD
ncbi:MAG TPA: hypothetical protein PKA28_14365 [Methylomusa anaerophila]|uniref:Uncharacterized protein n=1 Tax=Methylomusa anaerophila TaxID=1930071 RepID=A0A348AEV5_9FIRM|nr:hypothetical protein [Methylomusa anaerophila]BBB89603.1 hypothetical protein MAMMFC1_00236 [Methylomusa anaerophila]HML89624.1 hypothetical protein [Methylomusa anaerophila]